MQYIRFCVSGDYNFLVLFSFHKSYGLVSDTFADTAVCCINKIIKEMTLSIIVVYCHGWLQHFSQIHGLYITFSKINEISKLYTI